MGSTFLRCGGVARVVGCLQLSVRFGLCPSLMEMSLDGGPGYCNGLRIPALHQVTAPQRNVQLRYKTHIYAFARIIMHAAFVLRYDRCSLSSPPNPPPRTPAPPHPPTPTPPPLVVLAWRVSFDQCLVVPLSCPFPLGFCSRAVATQQRTMSNPPVSGNARLRTLVSHSECVRHAFVKSFSEDTTNMTGKQRHPCYCYCSARAHAEGQTNTTCPKPVCFCCCMYFQCRVQDESQDSRMREPIHVMR